MSNDCFGNPSFLLLFAILAMARVEVDAQTAPSSAAVAASTNRQGPLVAAPAQNSPGESLQTASAKPAWAVAGGGSPPAQSGQQNQEQAKKEQTNRRFEVTASGTGFTRATTTIGGGTLQRRGVS